MGTLIEPDIVLTAAHCLGHTPATEIEVVAGRDDLRTGAGVTVGASALWVHPERADTDSRFPLQGVIQQIHWPSADIGVLFLEDELPHETLPMANQDDGGDSIAGEEATMIGYRVAPDDEPIVWQQPTSVVDDETCTEHTGESMSPAPVVLHGVDYDLDAYLCAGLNDEALRVLGTDSGSPLVLGGQLVGVMSWSIGHGSDPNYFTRVATYAEDIQEVIDAGAANAETS